MENIIGKLAGRVYEFLEEIEEASVSKVTKTVEGPSSKVYMAIGWLARENKLEFIEKGRGTGIRLK